MANKGMIACTRCGHWHTDAEKAAGRKLSCTEVKAYWASIRKEHLDADGHVVDLVRDGSGNWFCWKCKRSIETAGE